MKRAVFALAMIVACSNNEPAPAPPAPPAEACAEPFGATNNPLDAELAIHLQRDCLTAIPEDPALLCRRAITDLLGRLPSRAEIAERCLDRPYEEVIAELQRDPRYLLNAERIWGELLVPSDSGLLAEDILALFADVRALHRNELTLREFAIRMSLRIHIIGGAFGVIGRFLGLEITREQYGDFERLYAPIRIVTAVDPELRFMLVNAVELDPRACELPNACSTSLFGGATLELPRTATITLDHPALRTGGELITRTPRFAEYAAERLLNRFLDWDDGDVFPRTPGALLPRIRELLAADLREHSDYPRAERLVLTSWLYRQKTRGLTESRPVYAVGPVKRARAETWLDSATALANQTELGTCDHRWPAHFYYRTIEDWALFERLSFDEASALMIRAQERLESNVPLVRLGAPSLSPDYRYTTLAQSLGGCGAAFSPSIEQAHEAAVSTLCDAIVVSVEAPLEEIIEQTIGTAFGRAPNDTERSIVHDAIRDCQEPECTRAICRAVLGAAEHLYY